MTETTLTLSMDEGRELAKILEAVGTDRTQQTMAAGVRTRREIALVLAQQINHNIKTSDPQLHECIDITINDDVAAHYDTALREAAKLDSETALAALNYREKISDAMMSERGELPPDAVLPKHPSPGGMGRGGFTLIENLATVAIIGALLLAVGLGTGRTRQAVDAVTATSAAMTADAGVSVTPKF